MQKTNQPKWKNSLYVVLASMGASALLTTLQWFLEQLQMGVVPGLSILFMAMIYFTLFTILFSKLFQQRRVLEEIEREKELQKLLDDTTRLYKSKVFRELASTHIRMCRRNNWTVGLILIDIDRLAKINEKYGYEAGNEVLKHFASILRESIRDSDIVARLDDDCFALLLPDCNDKGAKRVTQRIQLKILQEPPKIEETTVKVPFSSGVVAFASKIARYDLMVDHASEALETAKKKGGNRIILY